MLSPLTQRLTAPIPRPRVHLLGFHDDVLAPNGMTRAQALQSVPAEPAEVLQLAPCVYAALHQQQRPLQPKNGQTQALALCQP